jgi:GNAT superfamily N-acetyltransferase
MYKTEILLLAELHAFWLVFKEVLETEFPGYSKETVRNFLEKLYNESAFRYYLEHNLKTILVIKSEQEIVGFAVIDEPYGGVSLLGWLGVRKFFQKKGVGSHLIADWLNLAVSQGCHKAEVAAQPEAKDFYAKVGLSLEGHRIKSYFGIDQYIFGKVLR